MTNWSRRLFGRNRTTSVRFVTLAVGLFVAVFVSMRIGGVLYWVFAGYRVVLFFGFVAVFAGLNAYLNDGFLISCLLAYLPTVGLFVYNVAFIHSYDHPVLVAFGFAGVIGLFFGIPSGTVGYFLGVGVRRWTTDGAV